MGGHKRRYDVRGQRSVHVTQTTAYVTANGSSGGCPGSRARRLGHAYSLSSRWLGGGGGGLRTKRGWTKAMAGACLKMEYGILAGSILAFLLYVNTLSASFAYDDSRAILKNPDITSNSPLSNVFFNDFWGTPLKHSGSHKSYRPICVLTFRLNHYLGGLDPWGYHLGNVILHTAVTALFTYTAHVLLQRWPTALLAGVLFASHPIHTEAVAGVVGRADILACLFFLSAFLCYVQYCKSRTDPETGNGSLSQQAKQPGRARGSGTAGQLLWLAGFVICTLAAMLSKEQGITVLAVCAIYDVFIMSKVKIKDISRIYQIPGLLHGLLFIVLTGWLLVVLRVLFMGSKPPEFAPADNPASDSDSLLTRTLTFHYLVTLNVWLLLYPRVLSFDWSMGAVPLVESFFDVRNLWTLVLYSVLCYMIYYLATNLNQSSPSSSSASSASSSEPTRYKHHNGYTDYSEDYSMLCSGTRSTLHQRLHGRRISDSSSEGSQDRQEVCHHKIVPSSQMSPSVLAISLAFLIFPFVPASNLFFYVGFVIAERVLYIPSVGFCMLVAHGVERLYCLYCEYSGLQRQLLALSVIGLLTVYGVRTVLRNEDWRSEENLYRAGIPVNPAKAWGNLANVLNSQHKYSEAELAYRNALLFRSNMADVHYNLGILLQDQKRYLEAIESYSLAIKCRPRLTMAYLNLGIVYSTLGHKTQAEQMYRKCSAIDISGLKDPRLHEQTKISALYNLGRLLADQEQYQEAIEIYKEAITRRPSHYAPQSLYNMLGEAYFKIDRLDDAERWYKEALAARPEHIPAHLTMAKLLHRKGQIQEAEAWFQMAHALDKTDSSVYQHYGQFLSDLGRTEEAAEMYLKAVKYKMDDFELLFNTANALRQANRVQEAEMFYRKCVQLHPQEATAHMNLGAMLHFNGKLEEAEKSYLEALKLKQDDTITRSNLHKVRNLLGKSKTQNQRR